MVKTNCLRVAVTVDGKMEKEMVHRLHEKRIELLALEENY